MNPRTFIKSVVVLLVAVGLVAWEQTYLASPYSGTYSHIGEPDGGIKTLGNSITWNSSGVSEMRTNNVTEDFDQTAGCTADDSTGDKLEVELVITNIPNNGATSYNDCDGPLPNVNEEVELRVNPSSVSAGTGYYYDIVWDCNGSAVSGDVNISFEINTLFTTHDWLDKTSYSACSSKLSTGVTSSNDEVGSFQHNVLSIATLPVIEIEDPDGLFDVEVVKTTGGWLKAKANVDFLDPDIFSAYRALNHGLAASMNSNKPVLVVVTFSEPLQIEKVQTFIGEVNMQVISYGMFGYDESGKPWSVYEWPDNQKIEHLASVEGLTPEGVMTVSGYVLGSNLNVLNADDHVVLVDVLANYLQTQIEATGQSIALDQIGIPHPAWHIVSRELDLSQ